MKKLIAANWKMNLSVKDSTRLARDIVDKLDNNFSKKLDVVFCPTYVSLETVQKVIDNTGIRLGAQNLYFENDGAFTGEISAYILKSVGCEYVIIGHSERRKYLHETGKFINKKIKKALEFELKPIVCVGELLEEREDEIFEGVVEKQIVEAFTDISEASIKNIIVAYEPVWAIGTGINATSQQASDMHVFISNTVSKLYNKESSDSMPVIYGGSVNEKNALEILSAPGINGTLIGSASLKADEFSNIIKIALRIQKQ